MTTRRTTHPTTAPAELLDAGPIEVTPGVVAPPRVAVVIVTWNRCADVVAVLGALSRQRFTRSSMDVIVVNNASTDDTQSAITERWSPDRLVKNQTQAAHEPAFADPTPGGPNRGGFASLTLIRNAANLGGCGGFNTGLSYVRDVLDADDAHDRPEFAWLVDDDIDLPPDALDQLVAAMRSDEAIGLVGSRTCDIANRSRTIETTIYFDPATGLMSDEPPPGHPGADGHREWLTRVGSARGGRGYAGVRPVDIVSACSLLARWSAVRRVGLWDWRYFIYCDDADWCLRFARAGYRVVLSLDAVVYHTPWHHKLTPARLYYAQRNLLWLLHKVRPSRRVMARRIASLLRESLKAAFFRRMSHAEIIRRSVDDAIRQRPGKLELDMPEPMPVLEALDHAGALKLGARIALVCNRPAALTWARQIRQLVRDGLGQATGNEPGPRWIELISNTVPGSHDDQANQGVERIVYAPSRRSRLRRLARLLLRPPRVVVVFDNGTDLPVPRGRYNAHLDPGDPTRLRVERDGFGPRLAFLVRWVSTAVRAVWFIATLRAYSSTTRYG